MINVKFEELKGNYSTSSTSIHKCSMHFPNTCAISMSEAREKTNNEFTKAFKNAATNKCPHSYIRGAQDLAAILARATAFGLRKYGWSGTLDAKVPINALGKKGVVCFIKIPGFSGQGHIDLWDKTHAIGSDYWDAETIWMWELV